MLTSLQVVYLLIPTSNHNHDLLFFRVNLLYIFWFLHQTTTSKSIGYGRKSCISFDSYIKPQLLPNRDKTSVRCISFDSYIKPQPSRLPGRRSRVVYLLIPTSNHNLIVIYNRAYKVVYLLIPTSNHNLVAAAGLSAGLYIFWFLHQTTTATARSLLATRCISFDSYIKPQQDGELLDYEESCISFDSYIKPQLPYRLLWSSFRCISFDSYIKPQLVTSTLMDKMCCISFDSYIKPQPTDLNILIFSA